jgi:hypothetical protein
VSDGRLCAVGPTPPPLPARWPRGPPLPLYGPSTGVTVVLAAAAASSSSDRESKRTGQAVGAAFAPRVVDRRKTPAAFTLRWTYPVHIGHAIVGPATYTATNKGQFHLRSFNTAGAGGPEPQHNANTDLVMRLRLASQTALKLCSDSPSCHLPVLPENVAVLERHQELHFLLHSVC